MYDDPDEDPSVEKEPEPEPEPEPETTSKTKGKDKKKWHLIEFRLLINKWNMKILIFFFYIGIPYTKLIRAP